MDKRSPEELATVFSGNREAEPESFMSKFRRGACVADDVDDYIDIWHSRPDLKVPLHEYLGMTEREYKEFCIRNNSYLEEIK